MHRAASNRTWRDPLSASSDASLPPLPSWSGVTDTVSSPSGVASPPSPSLLATEPSSSTMARSPKGSPWLGPSAPLLRAAACASIGDSAAARSDQDCRCSEETRLARGESASDVRSRARVSWAMRCAWPMEGTAWMLEECRGVRRPRRCTRLDSSRTRAGGSRPSSRFTASVATCRAPCAKSVEALSPRGAAPREWEGVLLPSPPSPGSCPFLPSPSSAASPARSGRRVRGLLHEAGGYCPRLLAVASPTGFCQAFQLGCAPEVGREVQQGGVHAQRQVIVADLPRPAGSRPGWGGVGW